MLHISIGIGIGYWYRQWPILLDIGWLSLGIVLTLVVTSVTQSAVRVLPPALGDG